MGASLATSNHVSMNRMTRRYLLQAVVAGLLCMPMSTLGQDQSTTADAEAIVMDLAEAIWGILDRIDTSEAERIDGLANAIGERTDSELLGRLVLGRYWRQLSDDQRSRYQDRFPSFMLRMLASRLHVYARDAKGGLEDHFRLLGSYPFGERDVLVRSKVIPNSGRPIAVDWRLRWRGDDLAIIDLVIEGVSLLVSERSQFAAVIERRSVDDLIDEIISHSGS